MAQYHPGQRNAGVTKPDGSADVSAHHISSIAHLFFDDTESPSFDTKSENSKRFMVFSAGSSPVAAVAAAGLSMGSRGESFSGRVVLKESDGLTWSSCSFLEKSAVQLMGPVGSGENETDDSDHGSAWLVNHGIQASAHVGQGISSRGTVRWIQGGCADDSTLREMESIAGAQHWGGKISGTTDGLVWCLLEKEALTLVAAYRLGRLITLLQPSQVEILIFPDSWSKTGKPIWQRKLFKARDNSLPHQESLVNRCRELAKAVGECKVSLMPESLERGQGGSSGGILQVVASRMLI